MDSGLAPSARPGKTASANLPGCTGGKLARACGIKKTIGGNSMSMNRRHVLKGALAAGVATSALKVPAAVAQADPIKVGFLTIKSGPLASGGLQMEQGVLAFLKQRNNQIAGRPVELQTADTAGNPAQARTKTQELVERFNVHCLIGPLAAFEALAIDDYIGSS